MKPKIYVTRKIPEEALHNLKKECAVEVWEEERPVPHEVLKRKISDIDGLFCLLTENIDRDLLNNTSQLKIISNMAVGYNNIDIEAASEKGIMVSNTPGVLTETTADLTFALLMATSRRLIESSNYLKEGQWKAWSPMELTGQDIYGATIGIIGLGRIGLAVAKRARGFNMRIIYFNRTRKKELEAEIEMEYSSLNYLLEESDFVCVLLPYSSETHYLIDKDQLKRMKPNAILINTSRGGIVNESSLKEALEEGSIWGAGLDVYEKEPVDPDYSLLKHPNVVALPHIGSASIATRTNMAILAADNLIKGVKGQKPRYLVNKKQLSN